MTYFKDLFTFVSHIRHGWRTFRAEQKLNRKMMKKENEEGIIQCYLDEFEKDLPHLNDIQIQGSLTMFLMFYSVIENKHDKDLINEKLLKEYCEKYGVEFTL